MKGKSNIRLKDSAFLRVEFLVRLVSPEVLDEVLERGGEDDGGERNPGDEVRVSAHEGDVVDDEQQQEVYVSKVDPELLLQIEWHEVEREVVPPPVLGRLDGIANELVVWVHVVLHLDAQCVRDHHSLRVGWLRLA